jgi:hypothetical protein
VTFSKVIMALLSEGHEKLTTAFVTARVRCP